jgi:hypothetical protein
VPALALPDGALPAPVLLDVALPALALLDVADSALRSAVRPVVATAVRSGTLGRDGAALASVAGGPRQHVADVELDDGGSADGADQSGDQGDECIPQRRGVLPSRPPWASVRRREPGRLLPAVILLGLRAI